MPCDIALENPIVGFAVRSARGGEKVDIQASGFVSTEDGDRLVQLLDEVSNAILAKLPQTARVLESMIDHLVVVLRPDLTATVYVNEVKFVGKVQVKRHVEAGSPVLIDDVADVRRVDAEGITIPPDAGFLIVISARWRKGVLFDFSPLQGTVAAERDVGALLGAAWTYLTFQDRVKINQQQWGQLLAQRWFPFSGLSQSLVQKMIAHVEAGWDVDELLPEITDEARTVAEQLRERVNAAPQFEGHREVLRLSLGHFLDGDHISAVAMLYPRIEGVLRSHRQRLGEQGGGQAQLSDSAVADPQSIRHATSLLLPERFHDFIRNVYFAGFDPSSVTSVSRHSVAHGVAPEERMNAKAAVLAVLVLDHLSYLMR